GKGVSVLGGLGPTLGMEVIVIFALKTIHTVGFCYGFCPEDPGEKDFALKILLAAAAGSMDEKRQAISEMRASDESIVDEVAKGLNTRLLDIVAEKVIDQASPLLGILVGAVSDMAVVAYVRRIAKRAFQERWLRVNGKVQSVAPDPRFAR